MVSLQFTDLTNVGTGQAQRKLRMVGHFDRPVLYNEVNCPFL